MAKPAVVLAMSPFATPDLFIPELLDRLAEVSKLLDPTPLADFSGERADALLAGCEVLLTGWGCPPLDADLLTRAPHLRAIVHAAGTVKLHVTDACWDRGIDVTSAAAANAVPVAEYSLAAILMANKRMFQIQRRYREERGFVWWPAAFPQLGNYRKLIGIVGASFVGRKLIELLRPFDFEILVYDPYVDEAALAALAGGAISVRKVPLDDLVRSADVVSLHAPALLDTHQMIDRRRLALMKDGATLINTARGWLVDEAALEEELASGRLHAVIDTTEPEILPASSPLYDLPNVFLTPHIAGAMSTETRRMAEMAIDEIERYAQGLPFRYAVRREHLERIA